MERTSFGWLELLFGLFMIVLGVLTFMYPAQALGTFVLLFAIAAIFSGIADIAFYFSMKDRSGTAPALALFLGALSMLIGILLLADIGAEVYLLSILFPVWFIVHCVARLVNLNGLRPVIGDGQYWLGIVLNVLGIILGGLLLLNPFASVVALIYCVGAYLLVIGIESLAFAFSGMARKEAVVGV